MTIYGSLLLIVPIFYQLAVANFLLSRIKMSCKKFGYLVISV